MKIIKDIASLIIAFVIAFLIAMSVVNFIACRAVVNGESMYPTYEDGESLIIQRLTKPNRGDIVVFDKYGKQLIKRVIGVPGDTVYICESKVYVNDKELSEDYLVPDIEYDGGELESKEITLEDGQYIVLGDNRLNSKDSRVFGAISEKDIEGIKLFNLPF